jgi:hypothetical protein
MHSECAYFFIAACVLTVDAGAALARRRTLVSVLLGVRPASCMQHSCSCAHGPLGCGSGGADAMGRSGMPQRGEAVAACLGQAGFRGACSWQDSWVAGIICWSLLLSGGFVAIVACWCCQLPQGSCMHGKRVVLPGAVSGAAQVSSLGRLVNHLHMHVVLHVISLAGLGFLPAFAVPSFLRIQKAMDFQNGILDHGQGGIAGKCCPRAVLPALVDRLGDHTRATFCDIASSAWTHILS